MNTLFSALTTAACVVCTAALPAQDLGPRIGLTFYGTQPADTAGRIYGSGWKAGLAVHVRRGQPTEGRVRLEFGNFQAGTSIDRSPYSRVQYSAQTRMVGYDWLVPFGPRSASGVDAILGIGGAHWLRERKEISVPGSPYPTYGNSTSQHELAFAATVGFRFRLNRQFHFELHHVFTSLPASDRDFEDAELSHTAFGLGFRF